MTERENTGSGKSEGEERRGEERCDLTKEGKEGENPKMKKSVFLKGNAKFCGIVIWLSRNF